MTLAINVDSFFIGLHGYALERETLASMGVNLELRTLPSAEEIIRGAADAEVILVEHPTTPLNRSVIESLPRCRLIAKYGVGLDNIDVQAASERGIVVCHAPDYCVEEVSDHALMLILACARRMFVLDRHVRAGGWSGISPDPPIRRFREQAVGLVGFGRIARRVAEKLSGWRMRVAAFDPNIGPEVYAAHGVEAASLHSLLEQSDYLSLHVPLSHATRHLLGSEEFSRMRKGSFLINTSRGAVVDEGALIAALISGQLAGAALDVTEEEPLPVDHPLRSMPQVLVTPHFGARSEEAVQSLRRTIIHSIAAFSEGFCPPFVANPRTAQEQQLQPYHLWKGAQEIL
ncbi:MAG TPA: C-terminal binding protein [Acidobacteriaceae bacterium]|nr:C-terminal binding protein [Acidobacteriaceae bacterium]